MTGAGKTYTMLGDVYGASTGEEGICSLSIAEIFKNMNPVKKHKVKMSYLEIYNERIVDLLGGTNGLMIVEDPLKGVSVPDLSEYEVHNSKGLLDLLLKGNQRRTMAETSTNQFSSRSHAILQISIESTGKNEKGVAEVLSSKLSLVDLAGSERSFSNGNKGLRMLEGGKINRSLLALGNCINILSDKAKAGTCFIPYRDSKLTRFLKDSLGGNTRTVMIACIAPGGDCYEETVNTLKYAERAKRIKKNVCRNVKELELTAGQYKGIIEGLKEEIALLKEKMPLHSGEYAPVVVNDIAIKELDVEIRETKALKDRCKEQLMKESLSLRSSQSEVVDDQAQLCKISQQLLSKYEEHYEMKQSVQELKELNEKNSKRMGELQRALDKDVGAKIIEGLPKAKQEQIEKSIAAKAKEIEELQKAIETNENIKKQIEDSLKENARIQQKYLALVVKLQNHKKKDVLELQIAVRTLKLERMDLLMQNLEIQKLKRVAELEKQGKDKELARVKRELAKIKLQLKEREAQLANAAASTESQKTTHKHSRSKENSLNRCSRDGSADRSCKDSSQMGVTLTYSKSDESNPARGVGETVNAFECSEQTREGRPEQSFSSLSSVTVNYDDAPSSTDIELAQMNGIQRGGGNAKHVRSGSFNDNVVNRKYSKVAAIYFTNGSNPSKSKYFSPITLD